MVSVSSQSDGPGLVKVRGRFAFQGHPMHQPVETEAPQSPLILAALPEALGARIAANHHAMIETVVDLVLHDEDEDEDELQMGRLNRPR